MIGLSRVKSEHPWPRHFSSNKAFMFRCIRVLSYTMKVSHHIFLQDFVHLR